MQVVTVIANCVRTCFYFFLLVCIICVLLAALFLPLIAAIKLRNPWLLIYYLFEVLAYFVGAWVDEHT